jgi:non-homologous end joining protein Ku
MYYANEVRNFADVPRAENAKLSDEEIRLGADLIESMSDEFEPTSTRTNYRIRVLAMLEKKSKRQEIIVAPAAEPRRGQVIDLIQALKESLEKSTPATQDSLSRPNHRYILRCSTMIAI